MRNTENPLKLGRVIQFPRTEAGRRQYRLARLRRENRSLIRGESERFGRAIREGLLAPPTRRPYRGGAA